MIVKVLNVLSVMLCALPAVAAPVTYFEPVREIKDRKTEFYMPVDGVVKGSPAARAGVRVGDRIVGLDGLRVRTPAEYMFVRYFYGERKTMTVTVLRRGALIDLYMDDVLPVRRGGFYWRTHYDQFVPLLLEWKVVLPDNRPVFVSPGSKEQPGTTAESQGAVLVSRPGRLLSRFPARGWEALAALMESGDADANSWCRGLLSAYIHLRYREWAKALALITTACPPGKAPAPFLSELAGFYARIARRPPDWNEAKAWSRYGVDLQFFTVCYPYPAGNRAIATASFSADPAFQRLFDLATMGHGADTDAIAARATEYARPDEADRTQRYLGQVRSSLLDVEDHGAWPFRSPVVAEPEQCRVVLSALVDRLGGKSNDAVLTSFAILCPAILCDSRPDFERALRTLVAAGPREHAIANAMVKACVEGTDAEESYRAVLLEQSRHSEPPPFYAWLADASPAYRESIRFGNSWRTRHGINLLSTWTSVNLCDIARSLQSPLDSDEVQELAHRSLERGAPAEMLRVFKILARDLAEYPRQAAMSTFLRLAERVPAREFIETAASVFGRQYCRSTAGRVDVGSMFTGLIAKRETARYEKTAARITALTGTGAALKAEAGELLELCGTPGICLLLARALQDRGETKEAEVYRRMAVHFYEPLVLGYAGREYRYLARLAYRDMLSVPGLRKEADLFRSRALEELLDSAYVLAALDDAYAGDVAGVIGALQQSFAKTTRTDKNFSCMYDGRIYKDVRKLRRLVLCRTLMNGTLSEEEMAAVSGMSGIDMDALLEDLRKADLAASTGPVKFAVRLHDETVLVGEPALKAIPIRTSYSSFKLPLAKIRSVTFRDGRGMANVRLRNDDVVNGIVDLKSVDIKSGEGTRTIPGGQIQEIGLHKSEADRFEAYVLKARKGSKRKARTTR